MKIIFILISIFMLLLSSCEDNDKPLQSKMCLVKVTYTNGQIDTVNIQSDLGFPPYLKSRDGNGFIWKDYRSSSPNADFINGIRKIDILN